MPDPQKTIQAYFDAIRRKDPDAWAACFALNAKARDPADAPARVGRRAQREFLAGIAGLFEELDFRPGAVFPCGEDVAVYFRARCVACNGKSVEIDGVDLFRFDEEGLVTRVQGYWDSAPLFAAAG